MKTGKILSLVAVGVFSIFCLITLGMIVESVDSGDIVVIQSPVSGKLTWYETPGIKWQGWGKVTTYKKRSQLWFSNDPKEGIYVDESLKIRFNDGGHAQISGGISWEMPTDEEKLTQIHIRFGSQEAVQAQLIKTVISKAVYMTGPLMSSTESYAGRRNELLNLIEDQISNGICLTRTVQKTLPDPITNENKTITLVELVKNSKDEVMRAEESPLREFEIHTFNLSINEITYEERVEEQIRQQQQATMQVQIAIAEGKRAEQEVLTTKKEGEAAAAKKEWEQKALAAKATQEALMKKQVAETEAEMKKNVATTEAQQKLEVAKMDAETAEQFKKAEQLRGEGEAARKKAVMEADGALEKKLEAFVTVQKAFADAIAQHKGSWVPSVVLGSEASSPAGTNGASQLIDLLTAKTAVDLGLDMKFNTKVITEE